MPAKSVAQRRFMGMVRATQKGEMKDPSPEVRDAAKDMSVKAVREFAKTKEKNLPDKKVDEATYPCPESGKKEINERRYVSKHRPPAGWKPYGGYEKEKPEVNATANRIDAIRKSIKTKKEEVEHIVERGDYWHPDPEKDRKLGGPGPNQRAREDRAAASKPAAKKEDPKKLRKGESYMDYAKRQSSYKSSGSTARERLEKAGAKLPPKKEGLRDKIKRKLGLKEDAPTMSAGDGGFGGSADANGPTAGFDPPMTGLTTKKPRKFCNKKNKTKRC